MGRGGVGGEVGGRVFVRVSVRVGTAFGCVVERRMRTDGCMWTSDVWYDACAVSMCTLLTHHGLIRQTYKAATHGAATVSPAHCFPEYTVHARVHSDLGCCEVVEQAGGLVGVGCTHSDVEDAACGKTHTGFQVGDLGYGMGLWNGRQGSRQQQGNRA